MEEQLNTPKPLNFGKTMLASAVGVIIAGAVLSIISFFISVIFIASLMGSASNGENIHVADGTFIHVDLTQPVTEAAPSELEMIFSEEKGYGANDLLKALSAAKTDTHIKGIYVTVGAATPLSWGLSEELRNAILDFRKSGKPVVFYGEGYSQTAYYVATAGSQIYLHQDGMIDFRGLGAQVMYYKDLFDKLGVHVDLIRPASCAYKSAGETYTMNHMSAANREQIHTYINSIWGHVSRNIADARHISVDSVNYIADNLSGYLAKDALASGLVDTLCFAHNVKLLTREKMGRKHTLAMSKYIKSVNSAPKSDDKRIAIIYAEGNVVVGNDPGFGQNIYTDKMVQALNDAATNDDVCAIVLRVNSPGGAATTSQSITDAVRRAKTHKPVVVSMSDVAASAGYEISCLADYIVAQPTTITGSIGVFGTIPEVGTMLKKKIGITFDTAQTNRNSTGLSAVSPMSSTARAMMQRMVEDFYVTFVSTVAEGRKLPYKYVDSIARGRVWTGADAVKLGLVDTLGGIDVATAVAARLAKVDHYQLVQYPYQNDWLTQLQKMMNSDNSDDGEITFGLGTRIRAFIHAKQQIAARSKELMRVEGRIEQDLRALSDAPTLQARMPYYLIIE